MGKTHKKLAKPQKKPAQQVISTEYSTEQILRKINQKVFIENKYKRMGELNIISAANRYPQNSKVGKAKKKYLNRPIKSKPEQKKRLGSLKLKLIQEKYKEKGLSGVQ